MMFNKEKFIKDSLRESSEIKIQVLDKCLKTY